MRVEGSNGSVEVVGNSLTIRRKGIANVITQGLQGDKTIPLTSITAVQFRSAGSMMAGMIQFTLMGGREFRGGMLEATKDENAVLFDNTQEPAFRALRDHVQAVISGGGGRTQQQQIPVVSVGEELTKLADLLDRGVLTLDEFNEAKARTLAGQSTRHAASTGQATSTEETNVFSELPPITVAPTKSPYALNGCTTALYAVIGLIILLMMLSSYR